MSRWVGSAAVSLFVLFAACLQSDDEPALRPPEGSSRAPQAKSVANDWLEASCSAPLDVLTRTRRGLFPGRSPQVSMIAAEPNVLGSADMPNHSGPWPHLQKVPLVLYGPGFIRTRGSLPAGREVTLADIAPTMAELVGAPFSQDRPGRAITRALVTPRPVPPKLVALVVWDGGGTNVLKRWPKAWPYLKRLSQRGTSITGATVGSSPSVTPASHATMGTGAFPDQHGIVDIPQLSGDVVEDSFADGSPHKLRLSTIADLYDAERRNEPKVGLLAERGWHLGMLGHGAYLDGGDQDIALLVDDETSDFTTPSKWYAMPRYVNDVPGLEEDRRIVDAADGRLDSKWLGRYLPVSRASSLAFPHWNLYQTRVIKTLLRREGFGADRIPDLFFTNYKQIDIAGHRWNMVNREVADSVRYADVALKALVEFFNATVGRRQWVLIVTADHGQGPLPGSTGGWPIDAQELDDDIAEAMGMKTQALLDQHRPTGLWLTQKALELPSIAERISDFIVDYRLRDNAAEGTEVPKEFAGRLDEDLFAAAFPSERIGAVIECAASRNN